MKKYLLNILRDLIDGPPKGTSPYTYHNYNGLSWQAQSFSYEAKNDAERDLCIWARDYASSQAKLLREESNKTVS